MANFCVAYTRWMIDLAVYDEVIIHGVSTPS